MYDTWGGTSKIIDAGGLWKKLSPLEGFGPPTDFQVSWRIWLAEYQIQALHISVEFFLQFCRNLTKQNFKKDFCVSRMISNIRHELLTKPLGCRKTCIFSWGNSYWDPLWPNKGKWLRWKSSKAFINLWSISMLALFPRKIKFWFCLTKTANWGTLIPQKYFWSKWKCFVCSFWTFDWIVFLWGVLWKNEQLCMKK